MALLDRYPIDIPRELSEIRTQPWLSEGFGLSLESALSISI